MATSNTSKLGIAIPVPGSAEPFRVSQYNAAINALDGAAGAVVVASEEALAALTPYEGQIAWRTDLASPFVYDGSEWKAAGGASGSDFVESFLLGGM